MSAAWNDPLVLLASSLPIVIDLFGCFNNSGKSTNHSSGWCLYPEMKNDNWNQLKPFWSRSLTHTHFFSRLGLPEKCQLFQPQKMTFKTNLSFLYRLVGGILPLWKMMEFVNGKDDMPYMKWNIKFIMFETTNSNDIYPLKIVMFPYVFCMELPEAIANHCRSSLQWESTIRKMRYPMVPQGCHCKRLVDN